MTEYYIGKKMETEQDFLDAPEGLVIEHNYLKEKWLRTGHVWQAIDHPWKDVDATNPTSYFGTKFADSQYYNEVIELPEVATCSDCACKGESVDEETIKPVEFVPLYPNDPDNPMKETPRGDILREAEHLITGDRNVTYGSPTENFRNIGDMWSTRLSHKLKPGARLTGSDVADLMVLVKVARNIAQPKRDNYTDGAGYFACGYEAFLDEQ